MRLPFSSSPSLAISICSLFASIKINDGGKKKAYGDCQNLKKKHNKDLTKDNLILFFKLYKWYQIAESIIYVKVHQNYRMTLEILLIAVVMLPINIEAILTLPK